MSMMACKCGAVMVSDGQTWTCPISKIDTFAQRHDDGTVASGHQYNHSTPFYDARQIRQSVQPPPRVSPPNSMGPRMRLPFRRAKIHKGKRSCCPSCNPGSFKYFRRLEARFAAMRTR